MVRIPHFHCRGHGLISVRELRPHKLHGMAKPDKITVKGYVAKFENPKKNRKSPDVTDQMT